MTLIYYTHDRRLKSTSGLRTFSFRRTGLFGGYVYTGCTRTKTTSIFFTSPFSLLSFFLPPSLSLPPSLPLSLSLLPSLLPTAVTCSNFCFLFSFSLTLQCLASGKYLTVRGYYNYWKIYTANLYTVDHSHSLCTQDLHWTTHSTGESSIDNHMEHYRQHSQSV